LIRVGVISRLPLTNVHDVDAFQPPLRAVQSGDGATNNQGVMGGGALHVRVTAHGTEIDLVSCHLKSKLLQFPSGFQPVDEGDRARFGAYALYRRAAQATTIREFADGLLNGDGKNRAVIVLGDLTTNRSPAQPRSCSALRLRDRRIFNGRRELIDDPACD
jgi:hypothetical protein